MLRLITRPLKIATLLFAGAFMLFASGCIVVPDRYGYHDNRGYHGHHRHYGYHYDDDDGYRVRKYP